MIEQSSALKVIAVDAPAFEASQVAAAVASQFGLEGDYRPLVSERDQNFHLRANDGRQYVVKVTGALEDPLFTDFQVAALRHLESCRELQLPRVVATLDGQATGSITRGGTRHRLRVVSYVAGEPLASTPVDTALARNFGVALARLDKGLRGLEHEGDRPDLLWDLQRALELRPLLDSIDDVDAREAVAGAIDDFAGRVVPAIPALRAQVIHADANPENVLVDAARSDVAGFIDFGDMLRAPLVFEVAIAAAYLRGSKSPLELIAPFVAGYQEVTPLQALELELMHDLVRARLATTITLLYWRLQARDRDDPYRQKALAVEGGAHVFLASVDGVGRDAFLEELQ